jgi:hypothetical protein
MSSQNADSTLTFESKEFCFNWQLTKDRAQLIRRTTNLEDNLIWEGSLLPLFLLVTPDGSTNAIKANYCGTPKVLGRSASRPGRIEFSLSDWGKGHLDYSIDPDLGGIQFSVLEVKWNQSSTAPRLHSIYFGCDLMSEDERLAAPTLEQPFWPNWRAEGFGMPSAKCAPIQSFFRSWDFGQADLALGSFGPASGTPYAAAFPRPIYGVFAGGRDGWLYAGAQQAPDGAMFFQIRSSSGSIEWRLREDLWGAPDTFKRRWSGPLQLRWASSAWIACRDAFRLFPKHDRRRGSHQKSFWGTWGDFRAGIFDLKSSASRAVNEIGADLLCIDDPWETFKGSCFPDQEKFPDFDEDLAFIKKSKLGLGLWMPIGWIAHPSKVGLGPDDLLLNRDGNPIRANWALDPHEGTRAPCCLDPSSTRTRAFLVDRTQRLMRDYRPSLLKLDFGYGLPGPDGCAPRDPALRGELLSLSLAQIIVDAARAIDPDVTILGYALHPSWEQIQDQLALDDLGDAGAFEAEGHGQWSIWAALAGDRGTPIMASSGYNWAADTDILLNTVILGVPGANLPRTDERNKPISVDQVARRCAITRWHRPATRWEPLWLDSKMGAIGAEPMPRNWGRLEVTQEGEFRLTALALRSGPIHESTRNAAARKVRSFEKLRWEGNWAAISQTNENLFTTRIAVLVPFENATTIDFPKVNKPRSVFAVFTQGEVQHADWRWLDGILTLTHTQSSTNSRDQGIFLGYRIED